jgi:hypothetical protein
MPKNRNQNKSTQRAKKRVGSRIMGIGAAQVAKDRADYQARLNQVAKDFVGLNPKFDYNDPENFKNAFTNFSENFLPGYKDFVFTPMPRAKGSRTLKAFLFALVAANMVTAVRADFLQKTVGGELLTLPAAAPHGSLRSSSSLTAAPPTLPAARELPAKPYITQNQLVAFVNSQRASNPKEMISLAPLTDTYQTDGGLAILPSLRSDGRKSPLSNVDFSSAKMPRSVQNADLSGSKMSGGKWPPLLKDAH